MYVLIFLLLMVVSGQAATPANSVTIRDTSGSAQTRPITISRVFTQGDFKVGEFPQARINGSSTVATQVDVRNTWPDNSIKHALLSFSASIPANGSVTVDFVKQAGPNNAGYLDKTGMLNYGTGNWDAEIKTDIGSASARTMLQNLAVSTDINSSQVRYWLKGPIVTQVIVEDKSTALGYDFGSTAQKSLHPIFVLTFYPGSNLGVKVEYILENMWTTKLQDQAYGLTLTATGASVFTKPSFTHIAKSRWRKVFWSGAKPAGWVDEGKTGLNIDYNFAYMTSSKALPNYDLTKVVSAGSVATELTDYNTKSSGEEPQWCFSNVDFCGSYVKFFPQPGGRGDLGYLPRWNVKYLYTFDSSLYSILISDALASGRVPMHERESGSGLSFDSAGTSAFGRPYSINAHPQSGGDTPVGTVTDGGFRLDQAHQASYSYLPYLITGDWYFLEELYFWSSFNLNTINPCKDAHWCRHEDWGFLSNTIETRGQLWALRNLAHAALMAPDNTPEKNFYNEKLNNNIEVWEGLFDIRNGSFPPADPACTNFNANTTSSKWCWGRKLISTRVANGGPNPLGFPEQGDAYASQDMNGITDPAKVGTATTGHPFMVSIGQMIWGRMRELGFPVKAVQEYWARFDINLILHPDSNPYHIGGDYGSPMVQPNGQFFQTWKDLEASYLPTVNPKTLFDGRSTDVEFGYSPIAYAGLSFLPGVTTPEGRKGDDAWTWIKTNLQNQNLMNDNPKWAIVPRVATAPTTVSCDVNGDSTVNNADVQASISSVLGTAGCSGDLDQDGRCTIVDTQRVINAVLGGACRVGP